MLGKIKKYVPTLNQLIVMAVAMVVLLGSGIMNKLVGYWNKYIKISV